MHQLNVKDHIHQAHMDQILMDRPMDKININNQLILPQVHTNQQLIHQLHIKAQVHMKKHQPTNNIRIHIKVHQPTQVHTKIHTNQVILVLNHIAHHILL